MPALPLRLPIRVRAALIVAASTLGGLLLMAPAASAASAAINGPMRPLQARNQITSYFNRIYFGLIDAGTMKVQTEALTAGRLVITGACSPTNSGFLRIDDSQTAQTITKCQSYQGHHITSRTPRSRMPYTTQQHVSYAPLIDSLGERAAVSVGVADTDHSTATSAFDSSTDLNITYGRNPAATTRQLQQLKLHVQNGHETVHETWYS